MTFPRKGIARSFYLIAIASAVTITALMLSKTIDVSWFWITAPLWIPGIVWFFGSIFYVIFHRGER